MEKLDLQKFQDYKLAEKQLSFIHAGEGDTSGGWVTQPDQSVGGMHHNFRYDSDYINGSGAWFYNNWTYLNSWSSVLGKYHDEFVANSNSF